MSLREPWQVLASSFVVDPSKTEGIATKTSMFHLTDEDVDEHPHPLADSQTISSNQSTSIAQNMAAHFGVSVSYAAAFSAAYSMKVSKSSNSNFQTARLDKIIQATKYELNAAPSFALAPEKKLKSEVTTFFKEDSAEEIVDKCGEFYATAASLGGKFQLSYTMEVMEQDDESSMEHEFSASGGFGLVSASAKGGVSESTRKSNKTGKTATQWHCEGGDAMLWLKANNDNIDEIRTEWSASIDNNNLFPFAYKLLPIWELVAKVNPSKGLKVQEFLEHKWRTMGSPLTSQFLPGFSGTYLLRNVASGSYLNKAGAPPHVQEGYTGNHTPVQVHTSDSPDSKWKLSVIEGNYHTLENVASGLFLNKKAGSNGNETLVQVLNTENFDSQWEIILQQEWWEEHRHYLLKNRASGKYLNKKGHSNENETPVQVYDTVSVDSQWELIKTT